MLTSLCAALKVTYFQSRLVGNSFCPWWSRRNQPFFVLILLSVWASLVHCKRVKYWHLLKMRGFHQMKTMLLPWCDFWMQTQKDLFLMDISGTLCCFSLLIDFKMILGKINLLIAKDFQHMFTHIVLLDCLWLKQNYELVFRSFVWCLRISFVWLSYS